jgi:hypothetical protein
MYRVARVTAGDLGLREALKRAFTLSRLAMSTFYYLFAVRRDIVPSDLLLHSTSSTVASGHKRMLRQFGCSRQCRDRDWGQIEIGVIST